MENEQLQNECRATDETPNGNELANVGITTLSPFCDGICPVCESGFVAEINAARSTQTLRELSEFLKNEYGIELSKDQLHRHFKKYGLKLRDESLKAAYAQFRADANQIATHQKQTLFLASYTFEEILRRMSNGTMNVGVDDFERLLKLYYQILQNPEQAPAQGMVETFMLAQRKWNIPIQNQSFNFQWGGDNEPKSEPQPEAAPA